MLTLSLRVCKCVSSERDVNVHVHASKGILTSSRTGSMQDAQSWHKLYCVCFLRPLQVHLWHAQHSCCNTLLLHTSSCEKLPYVRKKRGNKTFVGMQMQLNPPHLNCREETGWKTKQMSYYYYFLPLIIFTTNCNYKKKKVQHHS